MLSRSGRGACRWAATIDPLLAGLRVPALVIHRPGDRSVRVAEGRYLAGHIPDAEYAELPGEDHTLFVGNQRATIGAVIGFLDRAVAGGALRAALRRSDRKDAAGTGWDSLTPSEQEVARLIAAGLIRRTTTAATSAPAQPLMEPPRPPRAVDWPVAGQVKRRTRT